MCRIEGTVVSEEEDESLVMALCPREGLFKTAIFGRTRTLNDPTTTPVPVVDGEKAEVDRVAAKKRHADNLRNLRALPMILILDVPIVKVLALLS